MRTFRIQKVLITVVLLFTTVGSEHSALATLPPNRSNLCLAMFRQVHATQPIVPTSQKQYTLNSLKTFRENVLRSDVNPSTAAGLITAKGSTRGFGPIEAASRVAGIEDFARMTETETPGEIRFMKTLTLVGEENIRLFLREYRQNLELAEDFFFKKAVSDFKYSAMMNAFLLASLNYSKLADPDATQMAGIIAIGLIQIIWKQDFIYARPFHWDYSFSKHLKAAQNAILGGEQRWALLSANFKINPYVAKHLRQTGAEEVYTNMVEVQNYGEAPPIRDRLEIRLAPRLKEITEKYLKQSWVGMDLFFDHSGAEPELHIILRGTEKKPLYPRTATEKSKAQETKTSADEVLVPGIVPGQ